jgi:hypothetical protein
MRRTAFVIALARAAGLAVVAVSGATSPKGLAWATGSTLHWRPAAAAFAPLT